MVALAAILREPLPGPATLGLAALAGLLAVSGIIGLYQGLAVGRMGVVAPVTGLIAATLPVVVGFIRQGVPSTEVVVGIAAALGAVILVSRTSDPSGRPSGIQYAIVGGVGLGLFNIVVGAFPDHGVAWPLAVIKGVGVLAIALIVVFGRRPWQVPRPIWPAVAVVAVLDMAGNAFYLLATQVGRLDIAATLSSLYPVTTVILAVVILHERVSRSHLVGIVMAALAIILISGGSVTG